MTVLCKSPAGCPKHLTICCAYCDDYDSCRDHCDTHDHEDCSEREVITDELVQFQSATPDVIQKIGNLMQMKKQLDEQEKQLKEQLVKAMEAYGVKSFENEEIKLTYVAPTTRTSLDSTRLKKDHPDIAEEYTKVSNVSASVRVTVK